MPVFKKLPAGLCPTTAKGGYDLEVLVRGGVDGWSQFGVSGPGVIGCVRPVADRTQMTAVKDSQSLSVHFNSPPSPLTTNSI